MPARKTLIGGVSAATLVGILGVAAAWFFVLRGDAPPPVSLVAAIAEIDQTASDGPPSNSVSDALFVSSTMGGDGGSSPATDPVQDEEQAGDAPASTPASTGTASSVTTAPEPSSSPEATPPPTSPANLLIGEWVISDRGESFLGYRVREELSRIGFTTAVGRTAGITGSMLYDGEAITAITVVADMTRLISDDARRDKHLKSQAIQTNLYPTSTFRLVTPLVVGDVTDGATLAVTATGDLTLHGVTRRVSIALQGQFVSGLIVIVGSFDIQFADYDIEQPNSGLVLSVEDHGVMELQLVFEHVSADSN